MDKTCPSAAAHTRGPAVCRGCLVFDAEPAPVGVVGLCYRCEPFRAEVESWEARWAA